MAGNRGQTASLPESHGRASSVTGDVAVANLRCAGALIATLARQGVRHIVVSSGSRCAPLVLAAGHHGGLRLWTNPDERAAGFVALGIGKATHSPAALICTSGTAAANYFPAIIEARMSHVPLIVLTADRPERLRGTGAAQTIDQIDLYGSYPLLFEDLELPSANADYALEWSAAAGRACAIAGQQRGPVHLNAGFDEPLFPAANVAAAVLDEVFAVVEEAPLDTIIQSSADSVDWGELIELIGRAKRPLVVVGPLGDGREAADGILELGRRLRAPIFADIASCVAGPESVIRGYDFLLRDTLIAANLRPDCVVRFGALPTSKTLNEWIASPLISTVIAVAERYIADPLGTVTHRVLMDAESACGQLLKRLPETSNDPGYASSWAALENAATKELDRQRQGFGDELIEADIAALVCEHSNEEDVVYLSSSMPIRWADMYARPRCIGLRILANRGANGIDGVVSSAVGAALGSGRTVFCIVGDLAFFHDQNSVWRLAEAGIPLKIILLNNNGGGIFDHLPISEHEAVYEKLVAMPHTIDFAAIVRAHGLRHSEATTRSGFLSWLRECASRPGPEVIEVRFLRRDSRDRHRQIMRRVIDAVKGAHRGTA